MHTQPDKLEPNETLEPNEFLVSRRGGYKVVYQRDGNLVLYRSATGQPVWSSDTIYRSPGRTVMEENGNLVIYNSENEPVWSSNSPTEPNFLFLLDEGHLVIIDADGNTAWDCCPEL